MPPVPLLITAVIALAGFVLSIHGTRALLAMRTALHCAELDALAPPQRWNIVRAFVALCAALAGFFGALAAGFWPWLPAALAAGGAVWIAPFALAAARDSVRSRICAELPVHLDFMALACETGANLETAISSCIAAMPDGPLRRAWSRLAGELQAGESLADALRALEVQLGLPAFSAVATALRNAERNGLDVASVLRARAQQGAASRFARAERLARAAPLKLWATLMLCIVPCTLVILSFPLARQLARVAG